MQIVTSIISPIVTFFLGMLTMIIKNFYADSKKNHENNPILNVTYTTTSKEIDDQICYFSYVDNALYHSIFADSSVVKIKISNYSKNPAYDVDIALENEIIHIDVIEEKSSVFIIPNLYNKEKLDEKFKTFLDYYEKYHDTFQIIPDHSLNNKYINARDEVIGCFNIFPNIITISFRNILDSYYTMSFEINKEHKGKTLTKSKPYIKKTKTHKKKKKINLSESAHENVTKANKRNPISF